jgi:hypothetical protein
MQTRIKSRVLLPVNIKHFLIAFLAFTGILLFAINIWIVSLEYRGTFHNAADAADLDGDGDLDVVLHNVRVESESVAFSQTTLWINEGQGTFSPRQIDLPPYLYLSAAGGDVDGDQDADLVVLASHQLMFFLNQGGAQAGETGVFKPSPAIPPPQNSGTQGAVVLGDLNNDGSLDGLVSGCCGMSFSNPSNEQVYLPSISRIWLNSWNPKGWFEYQTIDLDALHDLPIREAGLGDLDNNNTLDIFAAVQAPKAGRTSDSADRVLWNDGSGQFADSGQRLGESASTSVALGDLDSDGDLDALVGTGTGSTVWINQGGEQGGKTGTFAAASNDLGSGKTVDVFLEDLDGDIDLDVLLVGIRQGSVWWNDGNGQFSPSGQHFRYSERHGFTPGDFDGDGWIDIFSGEYSNAFVVWFNHGDGTFSTSHQP